MAKTTYEITLATEDHTRIITVKSDMPQEAEGALAWANHVHSRLMAEDEAAREAQLQELLEATAPDDQRATAESDVPTCAVHQLPMARMEGKRGPFWSCHQRDAQGTYCSYRPDVAA